MGEPRHRVFVYGTLLAGEANHHVLGGAACLAETATLPHFALMNLGAYPALVDAAEGRGVPVHGEVYEVDDETLARLDVLEDYPKLYDRRVITLADDSQALTYVMHRQRLPRRRLIACGNWRRRHG